MGHDVLGYRYRIFFSDADEEFVATCDDFPGLSGLGATDEEAAAELRVAVEGWVAHLRGAGQPVP
jgi:predicted RNase H-like HicB family nuclease